MIDFGILMEGDANDDNQVTSTDFLILRDTYNKAEGQPKKLQFESDCNQDIRICTGIMPVNTGKTGFDQPFSDIGFSPCTARFGGREHIHSKHGSACRFSACVIQKKILDQ